MGVRRTDCSLAVASVPSALVVGALLCLSDTVRGNENPISSDLLGRISGDSIESLVKQVGDFLPHLEKPICTLMLKNRHVCFKELFLRFFRMSVRDWQRILTVVQNPTNGCPRRARTSGGTVDDRVRGRRRGGGILQ